jgi:uncharacterized protein YjbI with pentapeptide repeats
MASIRGADFGGATFKDDADFFQATFKSPARFSEATFEADADFSSAAFEDHAYFSEATFKHNTVFSKAKFKAGAYFFQATFKGHAPVLGPMVVKGTLSLDEAQFATPARIEADAITLSCRRGRFLGGVWFILGRSFVVLDESDLSAASLLTGLSAPVDGSMTVPEQPKLLSLQRANVAGLTLGNVNLADCRFAGAHNLDKLRLAADVDFGLSPVMARWERRQVIAEESAWRAERGRRHWIAPAWPDRTMPGDRPKALSPGVIAGLYRALRKAREDAKDEPGAADFYYGEMEMRRHDHGAADTTSGGGSRGLVARSVLFAYWLVSGYGLRAWRSLTALAVVTALFALAFERWGFLTPLEPDSYWTSLLFAFRSTISLADAQVKLTAWGSFFQALLRLTGPVLLGLTLLALRGRVKR